MPHYVVFSPGYGAGWSTWNRDLNPAVTEAMLFDPDLIRAVLAQDWPAIREAITAIEDRFPDAYIYVPSLLIAEDTKGRPFRVTAYDGFEDIEYRDDTQWHTAPEWKG